MTITDVYSDVCDVCDCAYEKKTDYDVLMNYKDLCDVILMTVLALTFFLLLHEWTQYIQRNVSPRYSEERDQQRLSRLLRSVNELRTQNELLVHPETLRLNINENTKSTRNTQGYQTFYPGH